MLDGIKNGKVLVLDTLEKSVTPLFCPICQFPMKSPLDDAISFSEHGCCSKCDQRWTNFPGMDWKSGSHPSEINREFWDEYLEERRLLSKPLIIFK